MPQETLGTQPDAIEITAEVVAAYVSNNSVPIAELPGLIGNVHTALNELAGGTPQEPTDNIEKPTPAQIRKSVTPDGIVSFIDGKTYKSMKRHLTKHGFDPHSYRERYGLPVDYRVVAANYAAQRSALAKTLGLGRKQTMSDAEAPQE